MLIQVEYGHSMIVTQRLHPWVLELKQSSDAHGEWRCEEVWLSPTTSEELEYGNRPLDQVVGLWCVLAHDSSPIFCRPEHCRTSILLDGVLVQIWIEELKAASVNLSECIDT